MQRREFLKTAAGATALVLKETAGWARAAREAAEDSRPNIIFVLADDYGLPNVSCYGGNWKTPELDKLAASGIKFNYGFAQPLCGPTRTQLLTGRYAFRTGAITNPATPTIKPENEIMIQKVLKQAGYVTGQCGKWNQLPLLPGDWDFDEYLTFRGSGKYWSSQDPNYTLNGKPTPLGDKYIPDLQHEFVTDFMTRHKNQPFFIYYSLSLIHGPIMKTPLSKKEADEKQLYDDNNAYLDKMIGKLVEELERLGLRQKTLIFFMGDNGTARFGADRGTVKGKPISGMKGTMQEGGSRVPLIASWPGTVPPGRELDDLVDMSDFFPTFTELAGAKLPEGVTYDGHSLVPQLYGRKGQPREWIYVELGGRWYVREKNWKLNRQGELFDMSNAPWEEKLVSAGGTEAEAARKRLQAVLDKLNPAAGKQAPAGAKGKDKAGKKAKRALKKRPQRLQSL
jgi:arylsulfatase A